MKRKITGLVLVLVMVITIFGVAPISVSAATTWTVDDDGPADFSLIQDAIDAAVSGDTVQVAAGIYYENVTLKDGVEVLGTGADVTTIDGGGSGSVVTANNVGPTTVLDGFTITNGNVGEDYGGGMSNNNSSPTVTNCIFSGNTAWWGGGMSNYNNSSPTVTDCTFSGNSANYGGGMYNPSFCSPTVTNCIFSGNSAIEDGGGMRNSYYSSPTVTNCTFSGNSANYGGGMFNINNSSPTVTNCTFSGNSASSGGGMLNYYSSPTVTNCTFSGNSASDRGGGISNYSSSPTVSNCTFSANSAPLGGGICNWSHSSPTVTNCILWGDSPQEIYNSSSSTPEVTYCDVQGGYGDPADNNINADPMFFDPGSADYHLQAGSPCIDVGDNTAPSLPSTDFEGDPRIFPEGGVVDMGADEYCAVTFEVEIDRMFINFNRQPDKDSISISADFCLPEGATYDLSVDEVTVNIDGVDITIPAGSFKKLRRGERYIYNSPWQVKPNIVMVLNFDQGTWRLFVYNVDASVIDNSDGVDVTLAIGSMSGSENINMRVERLSYKAES